ncbi:MAG: hypothetical protein Q4B48_08850 [Syntrophomonadaceae bacterium]|nr:hypothetical protein [Syntrophomonadaceae bacterium]
MLNYKKPAFWIIAVAVLACIVVGVCLLTNPKTEPPGGTPEAPVAGETYVSSACLYMNPLSSYSAVGGDSGCKYIIGDDYFATVNRNDDSVTGLSSHPAPDAADSSAATNRTDVAQWDWQAFPYTDAEFAELFSFGGIANLSQIYDEILYKPLTANTFLLRVDGTLWLVQLGSSPDSVPYMWSIYALVPESAMGSAQWEYRPALSSQYPAFRFEFDMPYTEISAVCVDGGELIGFDDHDGNAYPRGVELTVAPGSALYWSPMDENRVINHSASIHFMVHNGGAAPSYAGTIYISGENTKSGGLYTATIVGSGLHMSQAEAQPGAVISATGAAAMPGPFTPQHSIQSIRQ